MLRIATALALPLALGSPAIALAATLHTGTITNYGNTRCFATNVSSKALTIKVTLVNFVGVDVNTTTCESLGPSQSCLIDYAVANTCRIEFKGGKNSVRGTLEVTGELGLIATSDAR
jgi:hypothetical protein